MKKCLFCIAAILVLALGSIAASPASVRAESAYDIALNNIHAIIDQYADCSDYEKLLAYRDEVCAWVTGMSSPGTVFTDTELLTAVFDGDPGTSVNCQGYGAAFYYLCLWSDFQEDVSCARVTGLITFYGSGMGGHMWNIVTMPNGKNYLCDLTNCDDTSKEDFFMKGYVSGDYRNGYVYRYGGNTVSYKYYDNELSSRPASLLKMSYTAYDPDYDPMNDFVVSDGVLTQYRGDAAQLAIPASLGITAIGPEAFKGNPEVASVEIPEGVTEIGRAAFSGCLALKEILLPDTLTTLGEGVFDNCALKKIALPEGLAILPDYAFYGCGSLREIAFPASLTVLGDSCLFGTALTAASLPERLTAQASAAFRTGLPQAEHWFTDYQGRQIFAVWDSENNALRFTAHARGGEESDIKEIIGKHQSSLASVVFDTEVTLKPDEGQHLFHGCMQLETIENLPLLDTSVVTSMNMMFGCNTSNLEIHSMYMRLKSLDLSGFETGNVTDFSNMFRGCKLLTSADVSGFNTSLALKMNAMFAFCGSLHTLNVSGFNTSHVNSFSYMFRGCSALTSLDVSGFDTSNAESFSYFFSGCAGLSELNISFLNTSCVKDFSYMFQNCTALTELDVSSFDTSSAVTMRGMFDYCKMVTALDVSGFDTHNVTDMYCMFEFCESLNSIDVSHFDTSRVTDFAGMFAWCTKLEELDLRSFDTSNADTMAEMLDNCPMKRLMLGEGFTCNGNDNSLATTEYFYKPRLYGYYLEVSRYEITGDVNDIVSIPYRGIIPVGAGVYVAGRELIMHANNGTDDHVSSFVFWTEGGMQLRSFESTGFSYEGKHFIMAPMSRPPAKNNW